MSSVDALLLLESARVEAGSAALENELEINGAGLLNSDTCRARLNDVLKNDQLSDTALFYLRAFCVFRPKLTRILQMITTLNKAAQSMETKRACSQLSTSIQKNMSEHSNVAPSIIPVHSVTQGGALLNFNIFCKLTSHLSNTQFIGALMGQRWTCQLKVASESFMSLHKEMQRKK